MKSGVGAEADKVYGAGVACGSLEEGRGSLEEGRGSLEEG